MIIISTSNPAGIAIQLADIERHVSNILSGLHSLGGNPIKSWLSRWYSLIRFLSDYSYEGIPDLRIIVLRVILLWQCYGSQPMPPMVKANLHQGAVGVGIEYWNRKCVYMLCEYGEPVLHHPDTRKTFSELVIPSLGQTLTIGWPPAMKWLLGISGRGYRIGQRPRPHDYWNSMHARAFLFQVANSADWRRVLPSLKTQSYWNLIRNYALLSASSNSQ